jgi:hypothetical protein
MGCHTMAGAAVGWCSSVATDQLPPRLPPGLVSSRQARTPQSRPWSLRHTVAAGIEPVATSLGHQKPGLRRVGFDLLPQPVDMRL